MSSRILFGLSDSFHSEAKIYHSKKVKFCDAAISQNAELRCYFAIENQNFALISRSMFRVSRYMEVNDKFRGFDHTAKNFAPAFN